MQFFRLLATVALTSLTCVVSALADGTSGKGLEIPIEKASAKLVSDAREGGYKIVTTDELKKWMDEKRNMLIISSLTPNDDKTIGIIPGAVNAEIPKTEKELAQANRESILKAAGADKERQIVVYCGFVACRRSHIGAKVLVDAGFKNVYRYIGGTVAWAEAGNPLIK